MVSTDLECIENSIDLRSREMYLSNSYVLTVVTSDNFKEKFKINCKHQLIQNCV
jgi:hypothetical protein